MCGVLGLVALVPVHVVAEFCQKQELKCKLKLELSVTEKQLLKQSAILKNAQVDIFRLYFIIF